MRAVLSCALCATALLRGGAEAAVDDTFPLVQRAMQLPTLDNSSLFSVIGRALAESKLLLKHPKARNWKPSQTPAVKANVTLTMHRVEKGSSADLAATTFFPVCFKTKESVKKCQVDLNSQGDPALVFTTHEPFSDKARLKTKATISVGNGFFKWPVTTFNVNCKMCGAPCKFKMNNKPMVMQMLPCPIIGFWSTYLGLHSWQAPMGVSIELSTQQFRSPGKEAMAFDILAQY